MTKIAIAALKADDSQHAFGEVVVRLVDAGSGGAVDGGVIVAPRNVRLDENGEAEVDLTPTAEVDPPGTCYAFTVVGVAPTVVRYLEVPSPNIVGPSEVPYAWDDPSLQVVFAEPPTFVPAPGSGEAGEVLTLVDDGNGKRYELRPATGGAADDSQLDVTASAPMLKASTVSAFYEAAADFVGVSAEIKAVTSAALPSLAVTEAGDTQDEINDNVSGGLRFAQASADLARTQVRAVAAGAGAPGANFTSPDPYLLVGAGATPGGYQDNCYRMPAVTATFDDGVDFVGDAVVLDDCGIDGYREVGTHGRLDIDYDRFEGALRVFGGLVSIFGEYGRVGDPEVATGEYAPGQIYSENADPPVLARIGDRIKWRETIENDRGDGKGRVRLWLPTEGVPDETAHGVPWRIVREIVLDTTTSVSVVSDYWYSGFGDGRFGVFEASWYEYGGGFSHRFHPDDLQPDDTLVDSNGNVATPLGTATVVPGSAGGGLELGETSTTAYRGDRGKTAYDHSQVTTGNPHGTTASDVGAVPTSRTIAGLDLTADRSAPALRAAIGTAPLVDPITGYGSGYAYYVPGGIVTGSNVGAAVNQLRNYNELWTFDEDTTIIPAMEWAAASAAGKVARLWVCSVTAGTWQPVSVVHDFGTIATDTTANTVAEWGSHTFTRGHYLARWATDGAATFKSLNVITRGASVAGTDAATGTLLALPNVGGAGSGSVSATNTTAFTVVTANSPPRHYIKVRTV